VKMYRADPGVKLTERMLSYIPEERMRDGMIGNFSITENMILREHKQPKFSKNGFLKLKDISEHTEQLIDQFRLKRPLKKPWLKACQVVISRKLSWRENFQTSTCDHCCSANPWIGYRCCRICP
jgi:hypothetical protein